MERTLSYRHRVITDAELVFIRELIAAHPESSRLGLSKKLCNRSVKEVLGLALVKDFRQRLAAVE